MTILAPFAPHLAEELWELLGRPAPVSLAAWPTVEPQWLVDDPARQLRAWLTGGPAVWTALPGWSQERFRRTIFRR
ncbi:MAG: class I tRNA ligase family protein [Planctomycetaceae bacterium]|nr:class I tRNA ligase family protein [Planctomycetaceae bacterium]